MEPYYTFHHELLSLKKKLMQASTMVEERVRTTIACLSERDDDALHKIILTDYEFDELEVEIEEDCLKILALHQPVASDLRFIVAVIKINNEIERIADMASSIALRIQSVYKACDDSGSDKNPWIYDYSTMSEKVIVMLKMSLDALVNRDSSIARQVFFLDDDVDKMMMDAYDTVREEIKHNPEQPGQLINTYLVARHLERIADRATNISEEVVHLVEGTIVRIS